jgi:CheY-like chemotaxis protein
VRTGKLPIAALAFSVYSFTRPDDANMLDKVNFETTRKMQSAPPILLVEDNPDDVILIECALEDAGITNPIHVVGDADTAIAYLSGEGEYADREVYQLPRVIFLDLNLPGKSGHYVLEWMAGQESLSGIVRVVITGSDEPADLKKAYKLGANSYFRKPLTIEQLTGPGRNLRMVLCEVPV